MKIFKVTLEPKDWFFFGGSTTLDNGVKVSYIAHSTLFPQQTALLGMIRYQLLKKKNLLFEPGKEVNYAAVEGLVGKKSFSMEEKEQTFGDILGLSPVFIEEYACNEDKPVVRELYPMALTNSYELSFSDNVSVYMTDRKKGMLIDDNDTYESKKHSNYMLWRDKNGGSLSINGIFERRMQVGITKNTDHMSGVGEKEGKFFKHEMIRFRNVEGNCSSFRFAFYVQLNNEELKSDFVFLGAERSCFSMKVSPVEEKDLVEVYLQNHPSKQKNGRIEILSPTYVEDLDMLNNLCDFHWSFSIPFRNLTFAKDGKGKLNSGKVTYSRSEICYNMLSAGSVLFFDEGNRKEIETLLNNKHLQSIGYNFFDSMNNIKTE